MRSYKPHHFAERRPRNIMMQHAVVMRSPSGEWQVLQPGKGVIAQGFDDEAEAQKWIVEEGSGKL